MSNTVQTQETAQPQKSKIFDQFYGGRCFEAIMASPRLTRDETFVLLVIGSKLDFNAPLHSKRFISSKQLCDYTKLGGSTLRKTTKSLRDKGYLIVEDRYNEVKRQISNNYAMSDKIFIEYLADNGYEIVNTGSVSSAEGPGAGHHNLTEVLCESGHKLTEELCESGGRRSVVAPIDILSKYILEEKGNRVLLPKKDSAVASPLQNGKPKRIANKKWERRNCQDRGIETFTPDCTNGKYLPNPGRRCIELFIGEMYDLHGYEPLKAVFDDLKQNNLRGKVMFNRDNISASFKEAACRLRGEEPSNHTDIPHNQDPGF
jgi:hypothetical protein